jgi:hypothetical protein
VNLILRVSTMNNTGAEFGHGDAPLDRTRKRCQIDSFLYKEQIATEKEFADQQVVARKHADIL